MRGSTERRHSSAAVRQFLNVRDLAEVVGKSERFVWALHSREQLPRPLRLGRSVLWRIDDVKLWIELGCPSRDAFERAQAGGAV